jgi:ABC-2 type transport system ATP-binding protein
MEHGRLIATGTPDQLKAQLGGDTVRIQLADGATFVDAATTLGPARSLGGAGSIRSVPDDDAAVELHGPDGPALLPTVLRELERGGLAVTSAEVRRPTLDDVFIALTGQPGQRRPQPADGERTTGRHAHGAHRHHPHH